MQDSFLGGVLWPELGFSLYTDKDSSEQFGRDTVDSVLCLRLLFATSGGCGGGGRGMDFHLSCSRRSCFFFLGGGIGVLFSSGVSGTLRVASCHVEDAFNACVALMGWCVVRTGTGWLTIGLLFVLQQQVSF
jgi:hypothetical protein